MKQPLVALALSVVGLGALGFALEEEWCTGGSRSYLYQSMDHCSPYQLDWSATSSSGKDCEPCYQKAHIKITDTVTGQIVAYNWWEGYLACESQYTLTMPSPCGGPWTQLTLYCLECEIIE